MRKMRLQFILLGIIAGIIIACLVYVSFAHVAIYLFARASNLEISYNRLMRQGPAFLFKNFSVMSKPYGLGISAKEAEITPRLKSYDFALKDVRFLKKEGDEIASYENLAGLVAVPFKGNWIYKEVSGEVAPSGNAVDIKRLDAVSEAIRLRITGKFNRDCTVDTDIKIYFGPEILKKVPEELSKVIMQDEDKGWKTLSVHLAGNYAEPAIQVSSKFFRLNIKSIEQK